MKKLSLSYKFLIAFIFIVVLAILFMLLYQSGLIRKDPVVNVMADNCYDETLRVITDEDYRPYSFYDEDGNYSGYDVELVTLVANKLQMNLDLKFMSWNEGIKATLDGEADLLMTCDYTDSFGGTDRLIKSEPLSDDDFTIYSKKSIKSLDDLFGKKIAIMKNGNVSQDIDVMGLTKYCIGYVDNRAAMQSLIDNQVDYAIMRQSVGEVLLQELGRNGIEARESIGKSYICYGIDENQPELVDRINKAVDELKQSGEIGKLKNKWLTTFIRPYTFSELVVNNLWIIVVFAALVFLAAAATVRNKQLQIKHHEEVEKNDKIMQDKLQVSVNQANAEIQRNLVLQKIIKAGSWSFKIDKNNSVESEDFSPECLEALQIELSGVNSWMSYLHPADSDRVLDAFNDTLQNGSPFEEEFRIKSKDGEYHWINAAGRMLHNEDGTGELYGVCTNIDDTVRTREEQQKQLQDALDMAESANKAKTNFLNNMSHDIRTPMNAIVGFTGLAEKHFDNTEHVKDYLHKIKQSSNHLLSLINDILDMSRIESGKMRLDEKEENLSDIIHTLRDIIQADVNSKQLDLYIDAVDVSDENVICDKLRLNQILLNILSNSIKYTPAGGSISLHILEKPSEKPDYIKYDFVIKDTGMGMSDEFLKTIYDPFTRVSSSTMSGIQGTGLGMAITKSIVDLMNGTIDITSELGKGTQTVVSLEFRTLSSDQEKIVLPDLSGYRILVVDDDVDSCLSLSKMMRELKIKVEWCSSGSEAVVRAREGENNNRPFNMIFMDWFMPGMNGIDATKRMRQYIGKDPIVILFTSYDWTDIDREARDAGVTGFANKPVFPSDLVRILAEYLCSDSVEINNESNIHNFNGKKILLVEDNELNREIATEVLEDEGFNIDVAEDGNIAVDKIKNAKAGDYDIILMDIQMPTMNGYEATKQIRALGTEISKIPIFAMTANAFEEDKKEALASGMNEHIAKPINVEKLKETLDKYIK